MHFFLTCDHGARNSWIAPLPARLPQPDAVLRLFALAIVSVDLGNNMFDVILGIDVAGGSRKLGVGIGSKRIENYYSLISTHLPSTD